ncbi:hypothetical protein JMN32_05240 [Fulvivirga sp. 29W222]|uniref:Uncharacterized protein n=1 Tax=Fulvivirga marina TaxID=2494733 RepID=A0A937FVH6_9BACT|nr:hypothetical protein [Fulvivirga marina]MBL6445702.1 hypothetical protein [Fulvivirga marina]
MTLFRYIFVLILIVISLDVSADVFIADSVTADTAQLALKVHALQDYVIEQNRIVSQMTDDDLAHLPLGVVKEINGRLQYILFDNLVVTTEATYVNAYVSLYFPLIDRRVAFAALKLKIHKGGIAASTGTRLVMLTDEALPIGQHITINLLSETGQNYIEWDCNGFKNLSLNGNVTVSQETAANADIPGKPVVADFRVQATDPGSIITQINLPAFEVRQLPGFRFTARAVTLDFSDDRNAQGFKLPEEYEAEFGTYPEFWTGIHFGELKVELPPELNVSGKRISVEARNMLIDRNGFTGAFTAQGLVSLDKGALANWPFSIEKFYVIMLKNQLIGSEFNGDLKLPLFDEPTKYAAGIYWNGGDLDYQVLVQTKETLHSDLLLADIVLDENSVITLERDSGRFVANAKLHGVADINGGSEITAKGLHFKNLVLSSKAPVVRGGQWGVKTESMTAGFPLQIDSIGLHHKLEDLALIIHAKLTLMDGSGGFSGETTVGLEGKFKETTTTEGEYTTTRHEFEFKRVRVHDIMVDVKTEAYTLNGEVKFFDSDPVYGNGFNGKLDAEIVGFQVNAVGTFGKLPEYRYWYVTAMSDVNIPLGSSNFAIYRLGGGLFYHMKQGPLNPDGTTPEIAYVPDADVGLGFKAGVTIGMTPDPYVFNGTSWFEIAFGSHGGVKYIQFTGDAYFMTPLEDRSNSDVKLYAELMMRFDFENKIFHATLETYINVYNMLKGTGPNDLAGWAELYFSPDDWFIHIGRPDKKIGLAFVALGNRPTVVAQSYFMAGHRIPDMPDLPPQVSKLAGEMNMSRDEGMLANARGMAFGTSLELNTGRINFLIFYGEIGAGLGFDLMLRDLSSFTCSNTGQTPGINGWYASGQAWAYIMAEIGVKVNLKFIEGEFPIINMAFASVLQAELPNPVYMRGAVTGEFNILGGLVKGKCKFKFELGEKCEIAGTNAVTGVKAIGQIKPLNQDKDVDVFTKPQVALSVPEGRPMEILNKDNDYKFYRVNLTEFSVTHNGQDLEGKLVWNEARNSVIYKTESILPPQSKIDVVVKVVWQEKVSGTWKNMSEGGKDLIEEESLSFTTGEAPDYIPESNVLAGYPFMGQYNFYTKETTSGYILLDTDQEYLFSDPDMNYEMHFVATSQVPVKTTASYSRANKKVSFVLPDLSTQTAYKMVLVREPKNSAIDIESNISITSVSQLDEGDNNVSVQQTALLNNLVVGQGFNLYENYFRTSKYEKFLDKIDDMPSFSFSQLLFEKQYKRYGLRGTLSELFDKAEVRGTSKFMPVVSIAPMNDNSWFTGFADPVIYNGYPVHPQAVIEWRSVDERGTREGGAPPDQPVIVQQEFFPAIKESQVEMGAYPSQGGLVDFMHDLDFYGYYDYYDIKNALINLYDGNSNPSQRVRSILIGTYKYMYSLETLRFNVRYRLPGTDTFTSERVLTINLNK